MQCLSHSHISAYMIAPGIVGTIVHLGCSTAWGGRCYHHPHRECFPVFPDHCCLGHHWVQRFEHNEMIPKARLAKMFLPVAFSLIPDIFPLRIRIESLQISNLRIRFLILLEVSGASCWLVDFASNFSSIFPPQVALVLRDPWALWVPYLEKYCPRKIQLAKLLFVLMVFHLFFWCHFFWVPVPKPWLSPGSYRGRFVLRYLITYAIEWPILLYVIKSPRSGDVKHGRA